jgi:hypothetical protein
VTHVFIIRTSTTVAKVLATATGHVFTSSVAFHIVATIGTGFDMDALAILVICGFVGVVTVFCQEPTVFFTRPAMIGAVAFSAKSMSAFQALCMVPVGSIILVTNTPRIARVLRRVLAIPLADQGRASNIIGIGTHCLLEFELVKP